MPDSNCIFCRIIAGDIPCAKVYESDKVLAYLDLNPMQPGHTLIVPKAHYQNILDIPAQAVPDIICAIQIIWPAIQKVTRAEGFNVLQNNFSAAGQTVFHTHWHLVPRHADDGLKHWDQGRYESMQEMQNMASTIGSHIQK